MDCSSLLASGALSLVRGFRCFPESILESLDAAEQPYHLAPPGGHGTALCLRELETWPCPLIVTTSRRVCSLTVLILPLDFQDGHLQRFYLSRVLQRSQIVLENDYYSELWHLQATLSR